MSWRNGLVNWECFETHDMNEVFHKPVMLQEILAAFDPKPNQHFIDATLGAGGHAQAILERTAPDGVLLGIERDPEMLAIACERLALFGSRFMPVCASYDQMEKIAKELRIGPIQGVFFDLGISSWHLERSGRGFSFLRNEPLDMRFNPKERRETAADLLQNCSGEELARVFEEYGEEPYAKRIATAIVRERKRHAIAMSSQLAALIVRVISPRRRTRIHAATKVFQALRIAVNHELEFFVAGLKVAEKIVAACGKITIIAFHGLEAKIIKNIFRQWEEEEKGKRVPKHAIAPLREEMLANHRARSAHLYAFQHL